MHIASAISTHMNSPSRIQCLDSAPDIYDALIAVGNLVDTANHHNMKILHFYINTYQCFK